MDIDINSSALHQYHQCKPKNVKKLSIETLINDSDAEKLSGLMGAEEDDSMQNLRSSDKSLQDLSLNARSIISVNHLVNHPLNQNLVGNSSNSIRQDLRDEIKYNLYRGIDALKRNNAVFDDHNSYKMACVGLSKYLPCICGNPKVQDLETMANLLSVS